MPERPPKRWNRVIKLKIDPQEVIDIFTEMTAVRDAEGPLNDGLTVMAIIILRRHPKNVNYVMCIMERVRCLQAMMADERWRGWSTQARDPDCIWVESSIYAATAICPLRWKNERFHFDPDEFFAAALLEREAEERGAQ